MEDVPTIFKNFENVVCGKKATETFKIENPSKSNKIFRIVDRYKAMKTEHSTSRLNIYPQEIKTPPGKTSNFTLTYLSHLENATDNYFYDIFDSERLVAYLNVQAKSVGPCLNFSKINLNFFVCRGMSQVLKSVEITNTSKCEAKFCFDLDENHQLIQLSQRTGTIPSGGKITLKFTFTPTEPIVYYKQIFCLVQFHKPLLFNISGVYKPKSKIDPKTITFVYPTINFFSNNYEFYMAKSNQEYQMPERKTSFIRNCRKEYEEPVNDFSNEKLEEECRETLSTRVSETDSEQSMPKPCEEFELKTYFVDVGNSKEIREATSLTNLSSFQPIYYQWDHDPENQFKIDPCWGVIEPNEKTDFSIYFTPSIPQILYHIELDVRIIPCNNTMPDSSQLLYPTTKSLKIIGNSFPSDSCGWMPQCTVVPNSLQLPFCVPGETVYATFMIERRGHLPVTFDVVTLKESNYTVQPPLGYFSGDFQLFVIQFKSQNTGAHTEDLKIVYNDVGSNYDILKVTTSVEIPELIFGKNNTYKFEPTFPKSKTTAKVALENPTNLCISYEFKIPEDITWIQIPDPKGIIQPKSFSSIEVIFDPEAAGEYLDYVLCSMSSTAFLPYTKTIQVQIMGSCQFGYLVAVPSIHDFGECVYGKTQSIKIHLFNFSPVLLYFQLYSLHRAFPVGDPERDVKITPMRGKVPGKDSLEVEVTITPHGKDIFQYAILCQILESDSNTAVPCEDSKKVFSFRFEGVLPAFQVLDINIDGAGPLFSPHWIWKMMNINQLNKALNSLKIEEQIDVNFPEAMLTMSPITIALLIESNRHGEIAWNMQKKVLCPCLEASERNFARAEGCIHAKAMTVTPTEFKLAPKKRLIMQIIITYDSLDECMTQWIINLPHHRKVIMNAMTVSLPTVEPSVMSVYLPPFFHLKPVFVGDPDPPVQLFWLYNNTHHSSSYVVDKVTLREPTDCECRVFDCINPNGVLPPFSSLPLAFIFRPNQIRSYAAEIYLCLQEDKLTYINIKGEGISSLQPFSEFSMEKTIPEKPILYNADVDLECSVNLINIKFLRTFSQIKRLFLFRNRSQTEAWAFQWHNFRIENMVQAQIDPKKGVLEPGQEITMTLVLQSFSYPTFVSFSFPCDVINYSKLKVYEASLRFHNEISEKYKEYFTITEKGTSYETPNIPEPEKPIPNHLFISVNANIISNLNINQKLTVKQQLMLKAEEELAQDELSTIIPNDMMIISIQQLLEKLIWNVLSSNLFNEKIRNLQDLKDYNYLQILPQSIQKTTDIAGLISSIPSKAFVQNYLEETLKQIVGKKFDTNSQINNTEI